MIKTFLDQGRDELAKHFHGIGAEIGVEQGKFSEMICKANPGVKLSCIDAWMPYNAYVDHRNTDKLERFYRRTKKLLAPYHCRIIRKSSMDAVRDFEDHSLDFVYIDANHAYLYALEDILAWSKKVKPGGIVAGHDYITLPNRRPGTFDVVAAVDNFLQFQDVELIVYGADEFPSWMYIKK